MRNKKRKPKIRNDTMRKKKTPVKRVTSKKIASKSKVKNAKHITIDGIHFKSLLEGFTYNELKTNGIKCEYEPFSFTLIPSFEYNGTKIRGATYKPDFVGDDWIIEVKGFETDAFKIRWKLFKWTLLSADKKYTLYLPKNQKQVKDVIEEILKKQNDSIN